jgi:tripartite-type tricarboxylate transporter receptor subunit TctC
MGAPAGTPKDIIDTLNKQINDALADPTIKQRLTDIGVIIRGSSPADFGKFCASETAKWGKVIRDAGIQPD